MECCEIFLNKAYLPWKKTIIGRSLTDMYLSVFMGVKLAVQLT